jgi:4-carboxymuconolactone decarboxylase
MSESTTREERFERGLEMLGSVNPEVGQRVLDSLADISPEMGHQIVAWGFGEIYSRPQLVPRDRQLVTLGMLTALGGCEAQLEVHIHTALNVGLTPEQIVEALLQSAGYCGFPRALNAMAVAKKVLAERGLLPVGQQPTADGPATSA